MFSSWSGARRYTFLAAIPAAACLALLGGNAAIGAPKPSEPLPVLVTNETSQPVAVSGSVSVGSPTVKIDTEANTVRPTNKTVELNPGTTTPLNSQESISPVIDVADYGTVRVHGEVFCSDVDGGFIDVYSIGTFDERRIDSASGTSAIVQLNGVYDVPGTQIQVRFTCAGNTLASAAQVWGRP